MAATRVRLQLIALEGRPAAGSEPADSRARLIVQTLNGAPILAVSGLTRTIEWLSASEISALEGAHAPVRTAPLAAFDDLLPERVHALYQLADPVAARDASSGEPVRRTVRFTLQRTQGSPQPAVELAITIEDFSPSANAAHSFQRETMVLQPVPASEATRFGLAVPFKFADRAAWGVAAIFDLAPGSDDPAEREQLARVLREASATPVALRPTTSPSAEALTLASAFERLRAGADTRQTLAFLADRTEARLCMEVVLAADISHLSDLRGQILKALPGLQMDHAAVGWGLDRQTLMYLAGLVSAGKLPPELAGILILYTGEAGRHDASLDEVVRGVASSADLQSRLVAENLIFLEDSSPAARVRAFDWLSAQGRAPAGYDPLGTARQRRDALDKVFAGEVR